MRNITSFIGLSLLVITCCLPLSIRAQANSSLRDSLTLRPGEVPIRPHLLKPVTIKFRGHENPETDSAVVDHGYYFYTYKEVLIGADHYVNVEVETYAGNSNAKNNIYLDPQTFAVRNAVIIGGFSQHIVQDFKDDSLSILQSVPGRDLIKRTVPSPGPVFEFNSLPFILAAIDLDEYQSFSLISSAGPLHIKVTGTGTFRYPDGTSQNVWHVEESDEFRRGDVTIRFTLTDEMPYLLGIEYRAPVSEGSDERYVGYRLEYDGHTELHHLTREEIRNLQELIRQ